MTPTLSQTARQDSETASTPREHPPRRLLTVRLRASIHPRDGDAAMLDTLRTLPDKLIMRHLTRPHPAVIRAWP